MWNSDGCGCGGGGGVSSGFGNCSFSVYLFVCMIIVFSLLFVGLVHFWCCCGSFICHISCVFDSFVRVYIMECMHVWVLICACGLHNSLALWRAHTVVNLRISMFDYQQLSELSFDCHAASDDQLCRCYWPINIDSTLALALFCYSKFFAHCMSIFAASFAAKLISQWIGGFVYVCECVVFLFEYGRETTKVNFNKPKFLQLVLVRLYRIQSLHIYVLYYLRGEREIKFRRHNFCLLRWLCANESIR